MLLSACGQSTPKNEGYEDLRDYLPTEEELTKAGLAFRIDKNGTYETTNEEIRKSEHFDESGQALISELGRDTSWSRGFFQSQTSSDGDKTKKVMMGCSVTSFATADSARTAVERFNDVELDKTKDVLPSYEYINEDLKIGDVGLVYKSTMFDYLCVEFSVGNIAVKVMLINSQDIEVAETIAQIIFDKLQ